MLRTYAVCEHCEESEIELQKVQDVDFKYEGIVGEDGEPRFEEIEGWIIKGRQDPEDPLVVEFDYYCPECAALDGILEERATSGV
jgi:hypothetical protein